LPREFLPAHRFQPLLLPECPERPFFAQFAVCLVSLAEDNLLADLNPAVMKNRL